MINTNDFSTVATIGGYKSHYTQDGKLTLCGREVSNSTSGHDMCKTCIKRAEKITDHNARNAYAARVTNAGTPVINVFVDDADGRNITCLALVRATAVPRMDDLMDAGFRVSHDGWFTPEEENAQRAAVTALSVPNDLPLTLSLTPTFNGRLMARVGAYARSFRNDPTAKMHAAWWAREKGARGNGKGGRFDWRRAGHGVLVAPAHFS